MPGGGSSSQSQTSTDKSTTVDTNTTTTIRDIGFTGDDAIELAALVQEGIVAQTNALGATINPIVDQFAGGFNQLVNATNIAGLSPEAQVASVELQKTPEQILAGNGALIAIALAGAVLVFNRFGKG